MLVCTRASVLDADAIFYVEQVHTWGCSHWTEMLFIWTQADVLSFQHAHTHKTLNLVCIANADVMEFDYDSVSQTGLFLPGNFKVASHPYISLFGWFFCSTSSRFSLVFSSVNLLLSLLFIQFSSFSFLCSFPQLSPKSSLVTNLSLKLLRSVWLSFKRKKCNWSVILLLFLLLFPMIEKTFNTHMQYDALFEVEKYADEKKDLNSNNNKPAKNKAINKWKPISEWWMRHNMFQAEK